MNLTRLFLATILTSFCFTSFGIVTCLDSGKIRYPGIAGDVSQGYCWDTDGYFWTKNYSSKLHRLTKADIEIAYKTNSEVGTPGSRACEIQKGSAFSVEFFDGSVWRELEVCRFNDGSLVDLNRLLAISLN